jgi:hypothetical protein
VKNVPPLLSLESPKGFFAADNAFESGQTDSFDLHLHFATGATTLAVREKSSRKYLAAECILTSDKRPLTIPEQFRKTLNESRLISKGRYRNTVVSVSNAFATLVPSALFRSGDEQLTLGFSVTRNDLVASATKVNGYDLQVVFGVQPELQSVILQSFPGASVIHALAPSLEYHAMLGSGNRDTLVQLIIHPDLLTVIASQGKRLLFANSFPVKDSEEAAYYTLFALGQLDVETSESAVLLQGTYFNCEELRARLRPYLSGITLNDKLGFATTSRMLEQVSAAHLFPAISIDLCA